MTFLEKKDSAFWLLTAAAVLGVSITLLELIFSADLYRDVANVYACMARSLANGEYSEAFHPSIPSLNVILAQPFIFLGMSPAKALVAVSSLFYLATVPFMYMFLKSFVPKTPAAFGALLFVCAAKIIRFSCAGLIDSGKIFFMVVGLFFAVRMIEEKFRSYASALWFGVALGGLSLARSEGVGNAVMLFGCVVIYWICLMIREKRLMPIPPFLAVVVVWAAVASLRMLTNWRFCGQFIFDSRIKFLAFGLPQRPAPVSVEAATSTASAASAAPPPPVVADNTAVWWDCLNSFIRGTSEVYFGFVMVGLLLLVLAACGGKLSVLWPDKKIPDFFKWRGFYLILLVLAVGNTAMFTILHLVGYRYFLPNIPLLMLFVVVAAYWLWSWTEKFFPRPLRIVCGMAVAILLAFQVVNGIENTFSAFSRRQKRSGVAAGDIMRRSKPDGKVWFVPQACIEWYHSGMRRAVPIEGALPDLRNFDQFDFVLLGTDKEDAETWIIAARRDLEEIPLASDSTVRLFRKRSGEVK